VRTAVSKGLIYRKVLEKHVLKNSMNPIVTAITGWLASLLAGAFFVEYVFSYKGLGFTTVTALLNYDIPVILGCVIFVSLIFVLLNIIVDLIYIWLNPREL
jgi:peptide/nickel transport system permease protein